MPIFINSSLLFILQKQKTEIKNLQHSSHTIALSKGTFQAKKAGINKLKRTLVLKGIFSEIAYACVLTYQI